MVPAPTGKGTEREVVFYAILLTRFFERDYDPNGHGTFMKL
jgi:hypothetical protein